MLHRLGLVGLAGVASAGGVPPSLDLSFLTPGTLPPGLTFTRASTGTYFDVNGTLQTATTNTPRWDYDPITHVLNGMLIEEARTNLLLNSATLGTQSVTTTANPTVLSFYGTGTVTKSGTATGALAGTGASQRVTQTFTPTAGALTLTVTGGVTNAQVETGPFPTSYIPTTGATATRTIEACSMPTSTWFNAAASSLAADFTVAQPNPSATQSRLAAALSDGTGTNRLRLIGQQAGTNNAILGSTVSGGSTTSAALGVPSSNVVTKMAGAWNGTAGVGSLNGGAAVSYAVGMPAGLNLLTIGNDIPSAISLLNGWVRRVRYWNRALSAAELQLVTA